MNLHLKYSAGFLCAEEYILDQRTKRMHVREVTLPGGQTTPYSVGSTLSGVPHRLPLPESSLYRSRALPFTPGQIPTSSGDVIFAAWAGMCGKLSTRLDLRRTPCSVHTFNLNNSHTQLNPPRGTEYNKCAL